MAATHILLAVVLFPYLLTFVSADVIKLTAIVDVNDEETGSNLESAVAYLNRPGTPILVGHTIQLQVVSSRDNDSFGAMQEVCTNIQLGVSAIVDVSSRYVSMTIRSLAEAMGITHVAAVDPSYYESDSRQFNTSVNIEPASSILLQSIRDIVRQENLTNIGIIYDQSFDLDDKPKRLLRNIPAQHLYLQMATTDDSISEQLDKIKAAELQHLFLASSSTSAAKYLGKANEKGMMSFKYSWYILTKNARIDCTFCAKASTAVVMTGHPVFSQKNDYIDIMNDWSQSNSGTNFNLDDIEMRAAFQYDMMKVLALSLDKLITAGDWTQRSYPDCFDFESTNQEYLQQAVMLRNQMKQIPHSGVFGDYEWSDNQATQQITLNIKRLTFQSGSVMSQTAIGNWTLKSHLRAFEGTIANKNIKKTYRVVTVKEPPFVFVSDKPPPESTTRYYYNSTSRQYYYGYCIDLMFRINDTMGFEFSLTEPEDGAYGTMRIDGTWNGLVEEIIKDRADIAVAPLSVMAERENVVDFTVPYYDLVGITILMKKPKFEYSVFKFMSVLEEAVWGCVFSAFIIVSVLLAIFDKYSPYSYQNNKHVWDGQGSEPRVFSLKEGLWFCMTSLTPQGGGEAPRALSGRLVAATWWMFGFIMIATYTANLAAFLTVSRLDQPIESLDDLAKQFKTKYAPQSSTATETYFRRMAQIEERFYSIWKAMSLNDSLDQVERAKLAVWDYPVSDKFTNMWAAMQDSGFPESFEAAKERIKNPPNDNEDFAFIGDATQNKYATSTDCDLWEVGEEFSRKPYALAVQEGSPLKNELSSVILQLLNQRVLEDLKTIWWDFDKKDCPKIEDESDGISIQNIGGVFLVIFIGIGLGLITLAFEYYWYKWRPAARNNQKEPSSMGGAKVAHENTAYTTNT